MPGPIVHLLNIQALPPYLRELGGSPGLMLAELLDSDPGSPYAGFGAQGPDFLFFSLKEYDLALEELANFLFEFYDALKPFIDFFETAIAPMEHAIEMAVQQLDESLLSGIIGDIEKSVTLITNTLYSYLAKLVTSGSDLFYPFYPKVQQGAPEDQWYWFDTLHYRRTGMFASNLWKLAQGDEDLMRYAVGYGSHIGGDVAGHPFVNAIVGGPYRSHWHRHHLVENWIDAYARKHFQDAKRTIQCLNIGPEDTYLPNAISGSYYYRLTEFPDGQLPVKLADMLVKAVDLTFGGTKAPPALEAADFDSTYRLWQRWFEYVTSIGSVPEPTPVPPPGAAALGLLSDFIGGFPSPPGTGGGGGGGGLSVGGIFDAIAAFVGWLTESLGYIFGWLLGHLLEILRLPLTEALATVKFIISQIYQAAWKTYDSTRFALVLGAYLHPEPDDFARTEWGTAFINTASAGATGGPSPYFGSPYPRRQEAHGLFGPSEHHLAYPGTERENPGAEAAPKPFYGVNPEVVIGGWHQFDPATLELYKAQAPYGTGPDFTHWVDQHTWSTHQFGSIPAFTARLLSERIEDLPNFNLDADRGYGWKTWRAHKPDIENQNTVNVDYIDP